MDEFSKSDYVRAAFKFGLRYDERLVLETGFWRGDGGGDAYLSINEVSARKSGLGFTHYCVAVGRLLEREVINTTPLENLYGFNFPPEGMFTQRRPSDCFVYAITDGENTKIGITKSLSARLRSLNTGSPRKLSVFYAQLTSRERAVQCERWLHGSASNCRLNGEWFSFSPDGIGRTIRDAVESAETGKDTHIWDWLA